MLIAIVTLVVAYFVSLFIAGKCGAVMLRRCFRHEFRETLPHKTADALSFIGLILYLLVMALLMGWLSVPFMGPSGVLGLICGAPLLVLLYSYLLNRILQKPVTGCYVCGVWMTVVSVPWAVLFGVAWLMVGAGFPRF